MIYNVIYLAYFSLDCTFCNVRDLFDFLANGESGFWRGWFFSNCDSFGDGGSFDSYFRLRVLTIFIFIEFILYGIYFITYLFSLIFVLFLRLETSINRIIYHSK